MKIKTRLHLSIILSLILTVTIGMFVLFALQKMNAEIEKGRTTTKIVKGMAELKIVAHEYLLHPTDRSLMQWKSTYDYLTKSLMKKTNGFESPAEKIALGKILRNITRFKAAFNNVTTSFGKEQGFGKQKSAISPDFRDRLISELLVKSQATVSPVFQLQQVIQTELMAAQQKSGLLIVIFLIILAFFVIAISLWINRSIARPLSELEKDIGIVGSGNLDHKVGTAAKDEIGQLSRSFDMMTEDLKETTTSIAELNKEIDERKQVEETLRESEEKIRSLVGNIPGVSYRCRCDDQWTMEFISDEVKILTGYPASDFLQNAVRSWASIMHPEGRETVEEYALEIINRKEPYTVEYRIIGADGDIRWCYEKGRGVFDERGKLCFLDGVIVDRTKQKQAEEALKEALEGLEDQVRERTAELAEVNWGLKQEVDERKQAEQALIESEEKYRTLVETVTDVVLIVDPEGKLTYLNPQCERISGYRVEDLIGHSFTEFLSPHYIESSLERFKRGLSGEESPIEEVSILHKDGSQVPVEINTTTLFDAEGKPVGRIGVVRDISERKRLETRLLQAQRLESLGVFAAGIAHDFENILSIIRGFTDIAIREVPEKSRAKQNLDGALRGVQRAADLVKQIIAFSRQSKPEQRPVLVTPIVEDAVSLLKVSFPSTIEIRLDLQVGSGTVYADPTQIHQILMNLGTNAAHAMREKGGILEVSLLEVEMDAAALAGLPDISPGDYLRMTVSDTGEGISPEVLDRIFDPYFSTTERGEGTGLGLSVVHGIVKSHGGAITVHSKPLEGTTFHTYLPLMDYKAEPEEQVIPYEPLIGGNERILFVDDEEDMVFLARQLLESLGYGVDTRTTGVEALALFRAQPDRFDLVITDMRLPGMTGERLAENIKKIRRDTPIILCTGFGEDISKERARRMGVREVLLKPLVDIDLTKTIRKVLDG